MPVRIGSDAYKSRPELSRERSSVHIRLTFFSHLSIGKNQDDTKVPDFLNRARMESEHNYRGKLKFGSDVCLEGDDIVDTVVIDALYFLPYACVYLMSYQNW
mmetsp:Transcript_54044/g.60426  ORF Transcript_54044/g.60426 Transcript_54044/m.60426 type:complete len:102 (-) Transcript_54044:361-666(-)